MLLCHNSFRWGVLFSPAAPSDIFAKDNKIAKCEQVSPVAVRHYTDVKKGKYKMVLEENRSEKGKCVVILDYMPLLSEVIFPEFFFLASWFLFG